MRCYQKIYCINWTQKVTNDEVLQRTGLQQNILLYMIWKGNNKFFVGKCENDVLFPTAVVRKIIGKTPRGYRKIRFMQRIETS